MVINFCAALRKHVTVFLTRRAQWRAQPNAVCHSTHSQTRTNWARNSARNSALLHLLNCEQSAPALHLLQIGLQTVRRVASGSNRFFAFFSRPKLQNLAQTSGRESPMNASPNFNLLITRIDPRKSRKSQVSTFFLLKLAQLVLSEFPCSEPETKLAQKVSESSLSKRNSFDQFPGQCMKRRPVPVPNVSSAARHALSSGRSTVGARVQPEVWRRASSRLTDFSGAQSARSAGGSCLALGGHSVGASSRPFGQRKFHVPQKRRVVGQRKRRASARGSCTTSAGLRRALSVALEQAVSLAKRRN